MEPNQNTGADPNAEKLNFDDAVGKEQPVNKVDTGAPKDGEQPGNKAPDAGGQKPNDQSGKKDTGSQGGQGADKSGGAGDKQFWGKFKTEDEAKKSYDEAQTKIIEQGKEINDLKTASEKNEQFLSLLDKALVKHPELANQLKTILSEVTQQKPEPEETDIDTLLDKKLQERETKAKIKADIDKWIAEHEDFKDLELGHKVLDIIEAEKLPFTAKTLQLVYDSVTKDTAAKKAADDALKKEEVKNLERENASAVGGGSEANKGKEGQGNPFDDLVGESVNPNKVGTR